MLRSPSVETWQYKLWDGGKKEVRREGTLSTQKEDAACSLSGAIRLPLHDALTLCGK